MLALKQVERLLEKLRRFETILQPMLFEKVCDLPTRRFETELRLHEVPNEGFEETEGDVPWGGEGRYCWFRGTLKITKEHKKFPLYIKPHVGGVESLLWINGEPCGIFVKKASAGEIGNHYCDLLCPFPEEGMELDIALEAYAGHYSAGSQPLCINPRDAFKHMDQGVEICVKNEGLSDFYFDLKTFNQMAGSLEPNSFMRAKIVNTLIRVHEIVYYSPEDTDRETFLAQIREAGFCLKELYQYKNTGLAPFAAVIGHSHMDTAWHWPIAETVKKCARTFANQLSLMEQYPEYKFIQSSAYHGELMRRHYPALFERMKKAVEAGRYEPNGAVWVECDCNLVNGEMLLRQFLWGQRFTEKHFGYRSNCFWLPDTFGYSVSIPQIMKGCGVSYFLTTKISWNDTNAFPYDTFYWKGLDGTKVLAHFTRIHLWPDPETCINLLPGKACGDGGLKEKNVSNMRLLAFGHGDGGGGPQYEMIEMARRCADLEGCPRVETMRAGDFMKRLEEEVQNPSTYSGELYLELHRGTLTNQHTIKRNNRLGEIAIHDLEYRQARRAAERGDSISADESRGLLEDLLVNQFHDILPGTCIPRVHDQSIRETGNVIKKAREETLRLLTEGTGVSALVVTVCNTLSFQRSDTVYIEAQGVRAIGYERQQSFGILVDAFASKAVPLETGNAAALSVFSFDGKTLEAPLYRIVFDERMYLSSLTDKVHNRELCGNGNALNTLLLGEDLPLAWDNWDIDADIELKMHDAAVLEDSRVVGNGPVEFRLRNTYRLTEKTTLVQDMVCSAARRQITFVTRIDWQDHHRLLKTSFDTPLLADFARQEVQFGYVKRPTTRNTDVEKAKFEVCNHKYTSLAETRYGVALLNDCKYGISVQDGRLCLTLHKGGCRPDERGDKGIHDFSYSFLFHDSGFSTEAVIKPAYAFNYRPILANGDWGESSFLKIEPENIFAEAIKPCEDLQKAYVVRLYEAEGTHTNGTIHLCKTVKRAELTNMLEETIEALPEGSEIKLTFDPFEIKTLKVYYS